MKILAVIQVIAFIVAMNDGYTCEDYDIDSSYIKEQIKELETRLDDIAADKRICLEEREEELVNNNDLEGE